MLLLLAALASAAPATTLDHRVEFAIASDRTVTTRVTWVVRIDDPAGVSAGLVGPAYLDGATDGSARMVEDVLALPEGVAAGQTFTLTATRKATLESAVFLGAPGLPVQRTQVTVRAPSNLPLSVWADPNAHPSWSSKTGRVLDLVWEDVPEGTDVQLVWSVLDDWFEAGSRTTAAVAGRLASKSDLGRVLGSEADSIGLTEVVKRVYDTVSVEPGQMGSWATARPARELVKGGTATGADRGVLLISLLKIAGYDARPAWYRPYTARGAFPITVPAPAMVDHPIVVVRREGKEPLWIDPTAPASMSGDVPAGLVGGMVWEPGDLPRPFGGSERADGEVTVNAELTFAEDGGLRWVATVTTTGTATEQVRTLLRPLDDAAQRGAIERLVHQAHPDAEVTVEISGVTRVERPLTIKITAREPGAAEAFPGGVLATARPVLAPALAVWLPPHLTIREVDALATPFGLAVAGTSPTPGIARPEALVARTLTDDGKRQVATITIERPYRGSDPVREAAAARLLAEEGRRGPGILLLSPDPAERERVLVAGDTPLDPIAEMWFRAFPYWDEARPKKADKILKSALTTQPLDAMVDALVEWGGDDPRPWQSLLALGGTTDNARLIIARGLARAGQAFPAMTVARDLGDNATDQAVRLEAVLLALDVQVEGVGGWKDPTQWLADVEALGAADDPRFIRARAQIALADKRYADAAALLQPIAGQDPAIDVMLALAAAGAGQPVSAVTDAARRAVNARPDDPLVMADASEALALVGERRLALDYALSAARLGATADQWATAADRALAVGDLSTAGYAARQASDLDPGDTTLAERIVLLAVLLQDRPLEDRGWERLGGRDRAGDHPAISALAGARTFDELLAATPENALLALLDFRDAEVVEEPVRLGIRAQMRLDAGDLDGAARDGVLLASRWKRADGLAVAFAATAGRTYSTPMVAALDRAAASDPIARATRMEYRLISGSGDPLPDARALGDDRGKAVTGAKTAAPEGWPTGLVTPKLPTPRGFKPNAALSVPGVQAFSDPDDAVAVLRIGGAPARPPPPIGDLYTLAPRPVADLPDGVRLVRLVGGYIPTYAALAQLEGLQIVGLAFTPEGALRALERGRP